MHLNSNSFILSTFFGGLKSANSVRSNKALKPFLSKSDAKNSPSTFVGIMNGSISLILHLGHSKKFAVSDYILRH